MNNIFLDTETCGYHGPIVLLQYAKDDGPIEMHSVWELHVNEVLEHLEYISRNAVTGFNLAFDWFHIIQMYTTLRVYKDRGYSLNLLDIESYADCEEEARDYCCIRPAAACDIMLQARQTHYQSLMDRNNIYIRKVPRQIAPLLMQWLNVNLPFDPIYFERMLDHDQHGCWRIQERKDKDFVNIYVRFAPSTRLKALAKHALGVEDPILLHDIQLDDYWHPLELGYAPFANAITRLSKWTKKGKKKFFGKWKGSWPSRIEKHIEYWGYHPRARQYASDDVDYTRRLYYHFGSPEPGDVDSDLACMVGAVRWKGFKVDIAGIQNLLDTAKQSLEYEPGKYTPKASTAARRWIADCMEEADRAALPESTDKEALKELMTWTDLPEVVRRATLVSKARKAGKEIEVYEKLLLAGRFHASFKVIGTLSSRMAGADGLNAQGIKRTKEVRRCFPLSFDNMILCGGDFDGFEVTIADAVYDEPKLRKELQETVDCIFCEGTGKYSSSCCQCKGVGCKSCQVAKDQGICSKCNGKGTEKKKIHATFGTFIYEGETYASIRISDGNKENDMYNPSKSGLFVWLFAGTEYSFVKNLGIPAERASKGLRSFENYFPNVGLRRAEAMQVFSPLSQPDGIGTQVFWKDCPDGVETLLGFRRYFSLEYQIMRVLFRLAQEPPKEWKSYISEVVRTDRTQTSIGALQSACYSAAFGIQGKIKRVAINHPIQGTGAQITKGLEHALWVKHQPVGPHKWMVVPMNIHDEIECPCDPSIIDDVEKTVNQRIEEYKEVIPLLSMGWKKGMTSWADK